MPIILTYNDSFFGTGHPNEHTVYFNRLLTDWVGWNLFGLKFNRVSHYNTATACGRFLHFPGKGCRATMTM